MDYTGAVMKTKPSLDARIKEQVGKSSTASMVPDYTPPPPPAEEEVIPDIRELVDSAADRLRIVQLVEQSAAWGQQEKEAAKARKPITELIKKLAGKYGISKAMCGEYRLNYYNSPRSTLSRELLLSAGVSPKTLDACTTVKDSYTLRISVNGQDDE